MDNTVVTFLMSTITGIVTFIIGQKRARKEVEGLALNNIERSLDIYNKIIDDLRGQVSDLLDKVNELETKIDQLKEENQILKDMLEKHDKRRTKSNASTKSK